MSEQAFRKVYGAKPTTKIWSTVEAKLSDEDVAWLKAWLVHKDMPRLLERAETSRFNMKLGYSYEVFVGLLLLTLYAEAVRRDGSEGNYWGVAARLWPESHKPGWFNVQGATARHRQILEEAACKLQLRNVFSKEGTSEWYVSGFLQFGFTRRGFESHLPEWLAGLERGGVTRAMRELLGPGNFSQSFYTLLVHLKGLKSGNVTEASLRSVLIDSPWVLPQWHERLIEKAKETPQGGGVHELLNDDFVEPQAKPDFLSAPSLAINAQGNPVFRVHLQNLIEFDMEEPEYEVTLGGKAVCTLVRQPDGGYLPTTARHELEIAWTTDVTFSELRSKSSGVVLHTISEVRCWDSTLHIQAWDSDGRRLDSADSFRLRPAQTFHLLAVSDLLSSDLPAAVNTVTAEPWRWYLNVPASSSLTLTFPDDAAPFWRLNDAIAPESRARTECDRVTVKTYCERDAKTSRLEGSIRIRGLPPGAEIEAVWFNREPILNSGDNIPVPLWDAASNRERLGVSCSVRLKIRHMGQRIALTRQVGFSVVGVLWRGEAGYVHVGKCNRVTLREISRRKVSLRAANNEDELCAHAVVMEGRRIIAPAAQAFKRPMRLTGLEGLGAKLDVYKRSFNEPDAESDFRLAWSVVDTGVINKVAYVHEKVLNGINLPPSIVVTLPHGIAELHGVVWRLLYRDAYNAINFEPKPFSPGEPDPSGRSTLCCPAQRNGSYLAVAAVSGTTPVGHAWFQRGLERALRTPAPEYGAESLDRLVRALRNLKAPIQLEGHDLLLEDFIARHYTTLLPVCLAPRCEWKEGDLTLVRNDDEIAWQRAIGSATGRVDGSIAPALATRILAAQDFEEARNFESAFRAACRLADISPRLCAYVLRSHFDGQPNGNEAIEMLIKEMTPSDDTLVNRQPRGVQVDGNFIKATLGKLKDFNPAGIQARDAHNLHVLLNLPHPAFRRKAMCLILEAIL